MSPDDPGAEAGRSVWENLRDVVLEPIATFEDVAQRPRWLTPLGVVLAITVVVSWVMLPAIVEQQRLQVLERVPPEQQEQALQQVEMFAGWLGLLFSIVSTPVMIAIVAFLLWGFALAAGAKRARFGVAFTAMTYASVIHVLQGIAQAVVVAIKGAEQVAREGGAPTFGLGLFLERGELPALLYGILVNVNFFSIWYAVVLGIAGVHAIKMSKGAATAFAVMMWLVGGVVLAFQ